MTTDAVTPGTMVRFGFAIATRKATARPSGAKPLAMKLTRRLALHYAVTVKQENFTQRPRAWLWLNNTVW